MSYSIVLKIWENGMATPHHITICRLNSNVNPVIVRNNIISKFGSQFFGRTNTYGVTCVQDWGQNSILTTTFRCRGDDLDDIRAMIYDYIVTAFPNSIDTSRYTQAAWMNFCGKYGHAGHNRVYMQRFRPGFPPQHIETKKQAWGTVTFAL